MAGKLIKYISLAENIEQLASTLQLKNGDLLPSERTLAKKFNCTQLTIRRALNLLEEDRKIFKIPNKGSFLGLRPQNRDMSKIVGIIFPEDELYYYKLFAELEKYLCDMGLHPILHISNNLPSKEENILNYLEEINATAIISVPNIECINTYRKLKTPLIFFDTGINELNVPQIISDDFLGATQAVEYLYHNNHRDIAYLGGIDDVSSKLRCQGYTDFLSKHNIIINQNYLKTQPLSREWGFYAANDLFSLPKPPTAILCGNDTIAAGVIFYCHSKNIKIPEQCSIIGFGNTAISKDLNLTSVNQHIDLIAKTLNNHLKLLLAGKKISKCMKIPTSLVLRGSTAITK